MLKEIQYDKKHHVYEVYEFIKIIYWIKSYCHLFLPTISLKMSSKHMNTQTVSSLRILQFCELLEVMKSFISNV